MRKLTRIAAVAAIAVIGLESTSRASVVIQEIYGDGGYATGDSYSNDYVELYNAGPDPVNINNWTINSAGYSSTLTPAYATTIFDSSPLAPGAYFLIEGKAAGTKTPANSFPTPNEVATADTTTPPQEYLYPSYSAGKIGLFDSTGDLMDYVGYGDDAAEGTYPAYEGTGEAAGGAAYPVMNGTDALTRTDFLDADLTDGSDTATEDNYVDFVVDTPNPHAASVPEPTTLGLLGAGSLTLLARRRRRA